MTTMIPDRPHPGATGTEIEVFALIKDAPGSDAYFCLHSLGLARHRRKDYAEADFVLIGPQGIFCLEVKGGEVKRSGGVWEIGWKGKSYQSLEGPFKQSQGTRWPLMDHLSRRLGRDVRSDTTIGWGVIFPDVVFDERDPEWDQDVVYDQRDKGTSFIRYAERLGRYFAARAVATGRKAAASLGPERVREIVKCLRRDFEVVASLAGLISESMHELVRLSPEQYRVLDYGLNESNPRILCDGGAGTGKTLIAMEAARRYAETGLTVLLICFNDNLGRFLQAEVKRPNVTVRTIHGLLVELIRRAGFGQELLGATDTEELFEQAIPALFDRACVALADAGELPQYDVVIIDEAQDILNGALLNCVDLLLTGGFAKGRWMVFLDSGLQSGVYARSENTVLDALRGFGAAAFVLKQNFRNPRNVVTETCLLTRTPIPECMRSLVSHVDYRVFDEPKDQARKLRALLVELVRQDVAPGSITVLSPKPPDKASIAGIEPFGQAIHRLTSNAAPPPTNTITAASVSAFKGLENEVIILTDAPTLSATSPWARAILYVAMTRARSKLYLLVDRSFVTAREILQ